MTVEEKSKLIIKDIKAQMGTDPCVMFRNMVKNEYINMHGPEHHVLDGAWGKSHGVYSSGSGRTWKNQWSSLL
ncbi:MAG: DUF5714 domain-containing protein [Treponema sp.]|nr:DUF5714 domain-containing protein [Treponema sp.]